jgi:hypothetical protein
MTAGQNQGEVAVQKSAPAQADTNEELIVTLARLRRENPRVFWLVILAIALIFSILCWQAVYQAQGA